MGPGGVVRELDSVTAPKPMCENASVASRGHQGGSRSLPCPPLDDRKVGEGRTEDDDGDDGTDTMRHRDQYSYVPVCRPRDDVSRKPHVRDLHV